MSLEREIHKRLSLHRAVVEQVPVERILTGAAHDMQVFPYVVITDSGSSVDGFTSSGTEFETRVLRMHVFAETLDDAKAIRTAVKGALNRSRFRTAIGMCLNMSRMGGLEVLEDDGTWHVYDDYRSMIEGEA